MDRLKLEAMVSDYGVDAEEEQERICDFVRDNDLDGLIRSKILKEKMARKFWKEIESQRACLHSRYLVERGPSWDIAAVILGGCGNGKTSLMNNICMTEYKTGESFHSKTRNITCERVQFIPRGRFVIYDTPGTTSDQEVSLHATLLRETLTFKPLNVVFVQVRYERRGMDFIRDMQLQAEVVEKYAKNIVYLVSHFDIALEPDNMIKEAFLEMEKRGMNQQVLFYSNEKCDRSNLAQTLYSIASNYPPVKIEIEEDEFMKRFRIGTLDRFFEKDFQQKLREMRELTEEYVECAVQLPNDSEKEYIIQELALDHKYSLIELLEQFQNKASDLMQKHDYYGVYFALQKIVIESDQKFQAKTRAFYSYNMLSRQVSGSKLEIQDLIKQCPCCKEIWFRVQSCPNTTCGQRPTSFWDFFVGRTFFNYLIRKVGKKIQVMKKDKRTEVTEKDIRLKDKRLETQVIKTKQRRGKGGALDRKIGCGNPMNFDELPRIPGIQEKLKEWYNVTDVREIDVKLKSDFKVIEHIRRNEQIARQDLLACEERLEKFTKEEVPKEPLNELPKQKQERESGDC